MMVTRGRAFLYILVAVLSVSMVPAIAQHAGINFSPSSASMEKTSVVYPQFLTLPAITHPSSRHLSVPPFTAQFGEKVVKVNGLEIEAEANKILDVWANSDGTLLLNYIALDAYTTAPRYDEKLHVLRAQMGANKIDGIFLRGDMSLVKPSLAYKPYDISHFVHDFIIPYSTRNWAANTAVKGGEVLQTSGGFLYRVLTAGSTGASEPKASIDPNAAFLDGTAQVVFAGTAPYSGAWKEARLGGLRWYFTHIAAGELAKRIPSHVKNYLLAAIKHLVRDWKPENSIQTGMKVGGAHTEGIIWECINGGTTSVLPAFSPNATIGTIVKETNGVKWRAMGNMHGNADWSLVDTNSDMITLRTPDSHDSYAASLIWAVQQYVEATGDIAWLNQASVHNGYTNAQVLKEVLNANIVQQFDNNLTKTFQHDESPAGGMYAARYLMDNCEVWAGLNSATQLFTLLNDSSYASYIQNFRDNTLKGIENLWQESAGAYRWEVGVDMTKTPAQAQFYPAINSQYWASLWKVPVDASHLASATAFANSHYQQWSQRNDIDDMPNLGAHVARVRMGHSNDIQKIVKVVQQKNLRITDPTTIFPIEFIASDAAFYLTLAYPD